MCNAVKPIAWPIICCLFLCFVAFSTMAQNPSKLILKGKIVDEHQSPLPYVSIWCKKTSDSTLYKSMLSTDAGDFSFDGLMAGKYFLQLTMMGYETKYINDIEISEGAMKDFGTIVLQPNPKLLKSVTITGILPFIERRADKIVVNLNGLADGSSMLETMNKLPGVQIDPNDQISLNGRGVQIYLDGKATTLSADALVGLLKGMSATGIQKVELIAQPSARYDAAGSGGIINIVRKRNYKAGLNGNVYGGIGNGKYNKHNGGLNLNYKAKQFNALLNADYAYNKYFVDNDIATEFYDRNQQFSGANTSVLRSVRSNRSYAPNLGLDFYISKKTTLSATVRPGFQLFHKDAQSAIRGYDANNEQTGLNNFSNLMKTRSVNFSSGMHLQHLIDTLGREYTFDADYYRFGNYANQDNRNDFYDANGSFLNSAKQLFDQDRAFSVYAVKGDYTHPLKKGRQVETGFKSSYVVSDNSNLFFSNNGPVPIADLANTDFFKYLENINALYVTYSQNGKKLSYQLGLRGEHTWGQGKQEQQLSQFERNYFQLFPSLHLDYKFNKDHTLSFGSNKRIERPGYESLNPLIRIINASNFQQGNPALKPAISYNQELTYSYKNSFYVALNYSFGQHDFTSVIVPYGSQGGTSSQPANARYSQYFGVFVAFNKPVSKWWSTYSNITLMQRTFKGQISDYLLQNNGRPTININSYNSFNLNAKLMLMALLTYRGKAEERTLITDPYFTFTAGIKQIFWNKRASAQLNITDIFNSYKSSMTQNSGNNIQLLNSRYETRTVKLNLSYSFGGALKNTQKSAGADEEKNRAVMKEN